MNAREHRWVDVEDRAYRASPAAFRWYAAAVGADPARSAEIARGLVWTRAGFVVAADEPDVLRRPGDYRPVVPGDLTHHRPAL